MVGCIDPYSNQLAQDQSELAYSELGVYPCKMVMVGIGEGITGQWSHNELFVAFFVFGKSPRSKKTGARFPGVR